MNIANYITYIILIFGLILCYSRPKTAFLVLMATQFTRISNIMGIPRFFSPLFIEFILLVIIYFRLNKQCNILSIAKHTKLLFLWIGFHMGWRLIQYLIYDDLLFVAFSGDIINLYLSQLYYYYKSLCFPCH